MDQEKYEKTLKRIDELLDDNYKLTDDQFNELMKLLADIDRYLIGHGKEQIEE